MYGVHSILCAPAIAKCLFVVLSPHGSSLCENLPTSVLLGRLNLLLRNLNTFKIRFPCELETMFRDSLSCQLQIFASGPVFMFVLMGFCFVNVDVQCTVLNYPAMAWLPVIRDISLTDTVSSLGPVRHDNLTNHHFHLC